MTEQTDGQLLDEFARRDSAAAFEQIVRRHINWVHSCARRMLRDADLADDVAQAVFILLARKAHAMSGDVRLPGWLFRATRFCAANAIKQRSRRREHEQEIRVMQAQTTRGQETNWEDVYPILDGALADLSALDRDAVLLRFYQGKSMAEVGRSLKVGEEAAKKRVHRALSKLRGILVRKGVAVEAGGLATVLEAHVTQAAPSGLVAATLAASAASAKATTAGMIAQGVGKLIWWAKVKFAAAMIVLAGVAGGATYGIVTHALSTPSVQAKPARGPDAAIRVFSPATTPSTVYDGLYEGAPGSNPGLTIKGDPNTFAVTEVVRFASDGKAVATDGRGKAIDASTQPLADLRPAAGSGKDVVVVFLTPGRERYDIDRLRVFDHMARSFIPDVVVTRVPNQSALRISANAGVLPRQIDLWLAVASYDAANIPVNLAAKPNASVAIGGAQVGFKDIRDGRWDFNGVTFTNENHEEPQTTLQLKATGNWNVGRYQIAAVSKAGQKYLSDFFIDLSSGVGQTMFFPFALDDTDHFELRPLAHEPPFFFDGIDLPQTDMIAAPTNIPRPLIVSAGGQSKMQLPCGAVVELMGIANYPHEDSKWWGLDGTAVALRNVKGSGTVTDDNGRLTRREFAGRLVRAPRGISGLMWQFDPSVGYAGGGNDKLSCVAAALEGSKPLTVRLGVASTPWRMLEEIPVDKFPAEAKYLPAMVKSLQSNADGVSLRLAMSSLPGNVRLVLIDRSGKSRQYDGFSSSSEEEKLEPWGYQMVRQTFRDLQLADVRAIRFETRQEEYAAFENVPLEAR